MMIEMDTTVSTPLIRQAAHQDEDRESGYR